MNFEEAMDILKNNNWSKEDCALFFYDWFIGTTLYDLLEKNMTDNCDDRSDFISMVTRYQNKYKNINEKKEVI